MFGPIQTNSLSWRQSPAAGRLCQPHAVGRHTVAAVGILLFFVLAARGQETNKPEGEQWFKRLDARQFSDLEETIQKVYATVAPSVVCISREDGRMGCSGVIVSSSGEVVTCTPQLPAPDKGHRGIREWPACQGHHARPREEA